jgi:hypothetical protein
MVLFWYFVWKIPEYYTNTYHRLYSIGDQFVYQIIIIGNAGFIHYVVMSSRQNSRPRHRKPVEIKLKYKHLCVSGTHRDNGSKQTSCAVGSDWLTVKGMEGTMRDVFEVYCAVMSRNCNRGPEEDHEVSKLV